MTNAPKTRKTHVIRIAFTNKAGEVLSDKSIDVERMDIAKNATQDPIGFWQALQRKLRWMDDPDASDDFREDGPESRLTEIVKVFDAEAEDDPDNPKEWAPVLVIKALRSRGGATGDQNYMDRLLNDDLNAARKVAARRIHHYDTNIDAEADAAFKADPSRKAYVVPGYRYEKDLATKDDSQYVEHEIIEYLKPKTNERKDDGDVYRGQQIKLLNQYMIDESEPAKLDLVGIKGFNPPFRLDPFQNIVNVNLSQNVIVVFVDQTKLSTAGISSKFNPIPPDRSLDILLDKFQVMLPDGGRIGTATAFKVGASAGEFVQVVTPSFTLGGLIFPELTLNVFVFAIDGNPSDSLDRAKAGTALAQAAALFPFDTTGIPKSASPPGLLWSAQMLSLPDGLTMNWKMRTGNHRPDDVSSSLPNKMVQCYPMGPAYTATFEGFVPSTQTYLGYGTLGYRLDRKGTGTAYGTRRDSDAGPQGVDPRWRQDLIGMNGIPFQDPPPLITTDVV